MDIYQVDEKGLLFVAPEISDWQPLFDAKIHLVIDLEGGIDEGIPTIPNELIYVYFPFNDEALPDLHKLHSLAGFAADLMRKGFPVLIHCSLGFNRSPLLAGIALTHLGMTGSEAVALLRKHRPGSLYNTAYAEYLSQLPAKIG